MEDALGMAGGPDQPRHGRENLEHQTIVGCVNTRRGTCTLPSCTRESLYASAAAERANLCPAGVCLQHSVLVWRCVNRQGHTCAWVLPASVLSQLSPDSVPLTLVPQQPVICLGSCVLGICWLPWPHLTLWDNWGFGACSKRAEQVPDLPQAGS